MIDSLIVSNDERSVVELYEIILELGPRAFEEKNSNFYSLNFIIKDYKDITPQAFARSLIALSNGMKP